MKRSAQLALWAGLLPIIAVNAAYLLNLQFGMDACMPYLDGCTSVSRGVRSGPGLWLFKVAALPTAICMALTWILLPRSLRRRTTVWLGVTGAAFLLVYAAALGTEGDIYRWMRRYGVVLYFGLTGLAQLLVGLALTRQLAPAKTLPRNTYLGLVGLTWGIGVVSAFKRRLVDDPAMQDSLQNALEWNFALVMALVFVALAMLIQHSD